MADFAKLFASNFFTRAQVDVLRRLYLATLADVPLDEAIAAHIAAADPHPGYLTEAEADALYMALGASIDPWTNVVLASDVTTTGTTVVDITGFAFTPAANKNYEFEANVMWESTSTTTQAGFQPGITWPSGITRGTAGAHVVSGSIAAERSAVGGSNFTTTAVTPAAANSAYPARLWGLLLTGASPSGSVQLRASTNASGSHTLTIRAGSVFRWRETP